MDPCSSRYIILYSGQKPMLLHSLLLGGEDEPVVAVLEIGLQPAKSANMITTG